VTRSCPVLSVASMTGAIIFHVKMFYIDRFLFLTILVKEYARRYRPTTKTFPNYSVTGKLGLYQKMQYCVNLILISKKYNKNITIQLYMQGPFGLYFCVSYSMLIAFSFAIVISVIYSFYVLTCMSSLIFIYSIFFLFFLSLLVLSLW
jgi:hypothetical protein